MAIPQPSALPKSPTDLKQNGRWRGNGIATSGCAACFASDERKEHSALLSYIVSLQSRDDTATKIRRRTWILECIQFLPKVVVASENSYNLNFWKNALTEEERNNADILSTKCFSTRKITRYLAVTPGAKRFSQIENASCLVDFQTTPKLL